MNALHLRRINSARSMHRFYRLDIQPDLFGRVLLMKQWGRVGTQGRMVAESYESEAIAAVALAATRGTQEAARVFQPQCMIRSRWAPCQRFA